MVLEVIDQYGERHRFDDPDGGEYGVNQYDGYIEIIDERDGWVNVVATFPHPAAWGSVTGETTLSLREVPPGVARELTDLRARLEKAEKDAERYRWLRESDCLSYVSDTGPRPSTAAQRMAYALKMHGKQTSDMIEIRLLCHHLGPADEPIWIDGAHFDYSANMDAAIDAAIAKERA